MKTRLTRRSFASAVALGAATAVRHAGSAAPSPVASPAAPGAPIAHPTGAHELILRIDISGGLIPAAFLLTELPGFSLYGDGRLIFLGPQIDIYPPPALPNLRTMRLTEQGIEHVLTEARQAGLFDGSRTYLESPARDAPTTTFTMNAAQTSIVVSAYALGIGNDPHWSDEERTARMNLFAFAQEMAALPQSLPAAAIDEPETAYQVDRIQVVAEPISPTSAPATPTPAAVPAAASSSTPIPQPAMDWPLATSLAVSGAPFPAPGHLGDARCTGIGGDDAATLINAFESANALTRWRSGGETYRLYVRPLLPNEMACRAVTRATPAATPTR
jgi:hypothetical protein